MSPQFEMPSAVISAETCGYSATERELLLRLAHDSIQTALEGRGRELDLTPPARIWPSRAGPSLPCIFRENFVDVLVTFFLSSPSTRLSPIPPGRRLSRTLASNR